MNVNCSYGPFHCRLFHHPYSAIFCIEESASLLIGQGRHCRHSDRCRISLPTILLVSFLPPLEPLFPADPGPHLSPSLETLVSPIFGCVVMPLDLSFHQSRSLPFFFSIPQLQPWHLSYNRRPDHSVSVLGFHLLLFARLGGSDCAGPAGSLTPQLVPSILSGECVPMSLRTRPTSCSSPRNCSLSTFWSPCDRPGCLLHARRAILQTQLSCRSFDTVPACQIWKVTVLATRCHAFPSARHVLRPVSTGLRLLNPSSSSSGELPRPCWLDSRRRRYRRSAVSALTYSAAFVLVSRTSLCRCGGPGFSSECGR